MWWWWRQGSWFQSRFPSTLLGHCHPAQRLTLLNVFRRHFSPIHLWKWCRKSPPAVKVSKASYQAAPSSKRSEKPVWIVENGILLTISSMAAQRWMSSSSATEARRRRFPPGERRASVAPSPQSGARRGNRSRGPSWTPCRTLCLPGLFWN